MAAVFDVWGAERYGKSAVIEVGGSPSFRACRTVCGRRIEGVVNDHWGTTECQRIAVAIEEEGCPVSVGFVAGLMRELALAVFQRSAYTRTAVLDDNAQVPSVTLDRDVATGSDHPP